MPDIHLQCSECGATLTADSRSSQDKGVCARCLQKATDDTVSYADQKAGGRSQGAAVSNLLTPENAPDVPGFELLEVLGGRKWGVVFKAREVKLNRLVAIRIIQARDHAGPEAVGILAQCRAVARLSHPNIVQVYEIGEHKGLLYFAMEFVGGGTLTERWKNKPSPEETAHLVEVLADAMHDARQHGIIHRDLKPANILLTPDGAPKIDYFGLARHLGDVHSSASIREGRSMPPRNRPTGACRRSCPCPWGHPE